MKTWSVLASFLMFSGVAQAVNQPDEEKVVFNQKLTLFMEVGLSRGGHGTETLPIFVRGYNTYVSGVDLTLAGQWVDVDEDSGLEQVFRDGAEAGGKYRFALGADIPLGWKFTLMAALGYQYDDVAGLLTDNTHGQGAFEYSRTTIDLIPFFNMGRHRVGLGLAYHYQPKGVHKEYSSYFDLRTNYEFDDGIGYTLRYDYLVSKNTSVGVRMTQMEYDLEQLNTRYEHNDVVEYSANFSCDVAACKDLVNADSYGIQLTYRFN